MVGAHGLDGSLKVLPSSDFVDEWPTRLRMVEVDRLDMRSVKVRGVRWAGNLPVIRLDGVETRTAAEGLVRARLYVRASSLPRLSEGEYYWHELVGRSVVAPNGEGLGHVLHVTRAGAHDVLEIAGETGRWLVPFVKAWVAVAPDGALHLQQDPRHAD